MYEHVSVLVASCCTTLHASSRYLSLGDDLIMAKSNVLCTESLTFEKDFSDKELLEKNYTVKYSMSAKHNRTDDATKP